MSAKMLVNRATGLIREPLSRPSRRGKTIKDRENGNAKRNAMNKEMRAMWVQETRGKVYTTVEMVPRHPG